MFLEHCVNMWLGLDTNLPGYGYEKIMFWLKMLGLVGTILEGKAAVKATKKQHWKHSDEITTVFDVCWFEVCLASRHPPCPPPPDVTLEFFVYMIHTKQM